jgi:hypothetical protein
MIVFRIILASVSRIGPDEQIEYLAKFEAKTDLNTPISMLRQAEIFP